MTSPILDSMNPAQRQAITAPDGPVLVLAGPGSGKTRVLTHRIAYLVQDHSIPAHRIMAATFTNKAAGEMRERVEQLIGAEQSRRLTLGTFHSTCARILRQEADLITFTGDFAIYDTQDQLTLIKQIMHDLNLDPQKQSPYSILDSISKAKNELLSPDEFPVQNYGDEVKQRIYRLYQDRLRASNAMDFDDLLMYTVRLFREQSEVLGRYQRRYEHVLVDEFQDTNMAQYELVRLLAGMRRNLFVVGDPDQSIYSFRGADYRNVKRFQQDFSPAVILLEENYRSHQYVLDAAMSVIRKNFDHIPRNLYSQRKSGPKLVIHEAYNEREESQFVVDTIVELAARQGFELRDCAVMYRLNAQSRVLEETFVFTGLPYLLVGATRFYGRKEIKDALAYLRVIQNPLDQVNLERILNVPPRGIGPTTIEQLQAWAASRSGGLWSALQALARGEDSPLSGRSRGALMRFTEMIEGLRLQKDDRTPLEILDAVLDETGYIDYLQKDKSDRGTDRVENIEELRRVAAEHEEETLTEFLNGVALVAETDNLNRTTNAPTLLTLHAAKGLEFPVVFIIGLEEGLLPYRRAFDDQSQLAEERRLMYVGLTRAKERIYLIYTFKRMMWGYHDMSTPSRFLRDIPPDITEGRIGLAMPEPETLFNRRHDQWETEWQAPPMPVKQTGTPDRPRRFQSGQRVFHLKFGEGVVIKSKVQQDIEEVEVLFMQQTSSKRIDGNYLQPMIGEGDPDD